MNDPLSNWMVSHHIHFTSDEIELFRKYTLIKQVASEAYITKQGVRNSTIYFICKGIIRTVRITDNKEITLNIYKEGEFISATTLSDKNELPKYGIQALTDVEIYYWDQQTLGHLQTHSPLAATIEKRL